MRTLTRSLLLLSLLAPSALFAQIAPPRPEALVLSPEPGERLAANEVMVAVSFIDPAATLDNGSVRVQVGERDVTAEAELRGGILVWRPRQPLVSGPHRVVVTGRDRSGAEIDPASWTFNVTTLAEAAPLVAQPGQAGGTAVPGARIRGTVVLEGASQSVSGAGAGLQRAEEFLPLMWLNAGGVISSGWRYSARVHMSGYESEFQQPVNRFRFDLRGPFLNLAVGDVNPIFQDLILAGRRVRGVQGDLTLGPLRIAAVSGESRRAVQGALSPGDATVISRFGTFGQNLTAVRPSIGSGEHFQLGLTAMQVRDDTTSLLTLRTSPFAGGSTRSVNPAPKDNLVVGSDLTLRFAGGRLLLQYENAASLFANDISSGPLTQAQLDSLLDSSGYDGLGVDPSSFERFFIVNASLLPLDPRAGSSFAQQARASVRAGNHLLVGEWRSIGGSYYTLGYPSLQRDRAGIRLRDSFSALSDALVVSVGFETDEDNLDDVKSATTTSQGIFGNVSWQESPNGLGLTGAVRIGSRTNDLTSGQDGALDEKSTALSGGASVPLGAFSDYRTRLSLNASVINRDDDFNTASGSRDLYLLGGVHGETDSRESMGALLFGVNRSELTGFANVVTNLYRATANGRHRVAPQWVATFDGAYTAARSPVEAGAMGVGYNRMELLGGAEFEWQGHTTVGFTTGLINYADQLDASRNTRELLARLRVSRSF
ncbi:MAG TPA: hypothetical protein VMM35_10280 [Longimicrobiales bacterium]|nr:hypothetical protein [Longimicrobiales bacterium]